MLSEEAAEEDEEVASVGVWGAGEAQGSQSPTAQAEAEHISVVVISLCRDQYHEGMKEKALDEIILKNRVSFSDIADNPSLLEHPNVMFFADRKPISLEEAVSLIMDMAREADKLNMISSTTSQVGEAARRERKERKPLKSFRVSSEVLRTWPLKEGENELQFIPDADERCAVQCKA